MKEQQTSPPIKGRVLTNSYKAKIERLRNGPRQQIRTLLRSFVSVRPDKTTPTNAN